MAVTDVRAVEVNGLAMGPGTVYDIIEFNPYARSVRHTQADRAWSAGSWSGREHTEAATIPLRLEINSGDSAGWLAARTALAAALRPSSTDVELRWKIGDTEYLMFARPRLVDPVTNEIARGQGLINCALVALDPLIYSATEHQQLLGLPSVSGGLTAPVTVPFTVAATVTAGRVSIVNAGTQDTALRLRIDANGGILVEPRVSLLTDGAAKVLRCNLTLESGQWLQLDTGAHTAYLNGVVSRRGYVSGDWPLLPSGASELAFDAGAFSATAQLTATWRDAWT